MKWWLRTWEEQLVAGLDRMLGFPRERKRFLKAHGYPLNLKQPTSFNEKICWKKIYDRNPILPVIADKYRVRDYVKSVLGEAEAERILIPLLAVADRPEDIDFEALPNQFVVKSNHGSGNNLIVTDKSQFDQAAFMQEVEGWLKAPYGLRNHEWAYTQIPRKIMVETLLLDQGGSIPADYKFSMIHGTCSFIQVDQGRYGNFTRALFDANWQYLDVAWKRAQGAQLPPPARLDDMLALAERLSAEFDYIRVDFYALNDRIYLGELTNYPARGRGRFKPAEFDFEVGRRWSLAGAASGTDSGR